MGKYLFQAHYRGVTVTDDEGEEFSSLQQAEAHAATIARELARNSDTGVTVCVLDPDRALLAKTASG
jgi:uncharacterized protein DUF6894